MDVVACSYRGPACMWYGEIEMDLFEGRIVIFREVLGSVDYAWLICGWGTPGVSWRVEGIMQVELMRSREDQENIQIAFRSFLNGNIAFLESELVPVDLILG